MLIGGDWPRPTLDCAGAEGQRFIPALSGGSGFKKEPRLADDCSELVMLSPLTVLVLLRLGAGDGPASGNFISIFFISAFSKGRCRISEALGLASAWCHRSSEHSCLSPVENAGGSNGGLPEVICRTKEAMLRASNGTCNAASSYKMQPNAHMSLAKEYSLSVQISGLK